MSAAGPISTGAFFSYFPTPFWYQAVTIFGPKRWSDKRKGTDCETQSVCHAIFAFFGLISGPKVWLMFCLGSCVVLFCMPRAVCTVASGILCTMPACALVCMPSGVVHLVAHVGNATIKMLSFAAGV